MKKVLDVVIKITFLLGAALFGCIASGLFYTTFIM